jgi:ribosome-associated protein
MVQHCNKIGGKMAENKELAFAVSQALSEKKAIDVVVIDIAEKSSFADYFVIASGGNDRQVGSLADEAEDAMSKFGIEPKNIEGRPDSGWVLMDYGDIIVNIFSKEQREVYRIEKIWGDGFIVDAGDFGADDFEDEIDLDGVDADGGDDLFDFGFEDIDDIEDGVEEPTLI